MNRTRNLIWLVGFAGVTGCVAPTQRVGQTATVNFGVVRSAEQITLDSNAAQGAVVGGTLGLISSRGSSRNRRVANGIFGAALGGAVTAAAEGNREGMSYTVAMLDGSTIRIVTDQREIRMDDCVAIERVGQTANIRRVADGYCDVANRTAVNLVVSETREDALACDSAKQELADATTNEEADLAIRKVELLCDS
ncbi:MAG TPA: hypothetical protein VF339_12555 [Gammaproteobacteria bacterium]